MWLLGEQNGSSAVSNVYRRVGRAISVGGVVGRGSSRGGGIVRAHVATAFFRHWDGIFGRIALGAVRRLNHQLRDRDRPLLHRDGDDLVGRRRLPRRTLEEYGEGDSSLRRGVSG